MPSKNFSFCGGEASSFLVVGPLRNHIELLLEEVAGTAPPRGASLLAFGLHPDAPVAR